MSHTREDSLAQSTKPARHVASISLLLGTGIAASYALFAVIAAHHYPTAYSPFHNNTLSQLGNSNLNPHGAGYYLVGCAVSGLLTMMFFLSLLSWRRTGTVLQNRALLLVQALGVVGGFALFMNAIFPENHLAIHHFWAGVVFNSLGAAMLVAPFALWRRSYPNLRMVAVTVAGTAAVALMFTFARTHWLEWLPVAIFLLSPPLLGLHTRGAVTLQPVPAE